MLQDLCEDHQFCNSFICEDNKHSALVLPDSFADPYTFILRFVHSQLVNKQEDTVKSAKYIRCHYPRLIMFILLCAVNHAHIKNFILKATRGWLQQ